MGTKRLNLLAGDVWAFVFGQLDAEPDWTGDDVGRVAAVVQRAFEAAVRAVDTERARAGFYRSGPECIVCGRGRP